MGILYISEYVDAKLNSGIEPATTNHTVTFTTSAGISAVFGAPVGFVRLNTDTACAIRFGTNPTATTSDKRMAADSTEYFAVHPGLRVSVVAFA